MEKQGKNGMSPVLDRIRILDFKIKFILFNCIQAFPRRHTNIPKLGAKFYAIGKQNRQIIKSQKEELLSCSI